jgi:toxin ParE1/3/4
MVFDVVLTEDAVGDLDEIHRYIAEQDSPRKADAVLTRIEEAIERVRTSPHGGAHPRELVSLGIREYRETFFKPYRVIYRVVDRTVVVFIITDGRQDMQSLLTRRLLRA